MPPRCKSKMMRSSCLTAYAILNKPLIIKSRMSFVKLALALEGSRRCHGDEMRSR
ncbi:hypothetical protein Plhal304r1_c030g0098131 [Plasmopara halstedii]